MIFEFYSFFIQNENYLIPIDDFKEESKEKVKLSGSDLRQYGINAQNHLNNIDDRQPFLILFFLDCCRNYHLRNSQLKNYRGEQIDHSQGLTTMPDKVGSFIAFACAPGRIADDGNNGEINGLFTKHFLKHLSKPNEDIEMILRDVRKDVMKESNNRQIPHITSVLTHRNIYLNEIKQGNKSIFLLMNLLK